MIALCSIAAEGAGFDVLLTAYRNIPYQQNLAGRKLAIVALDTPRRPIIRVHPALVREAVAAAKEGTQRHPLPTSAPGKQVSTAGAGRSRRCVPPVGASSALLPRMALGKCAVPGA